MTQPDTPAAQPDLRSSPLPSPPLYMLEKADRHDGLVECKGCQERTMNSQVDADLGSDVLVLGCYHLAPVDAFVQAGRVQDD